MFFQSVCTTSHPTSNVWGKVQVFQHPHQHLALSGCLIIAILVGIYGISYGIHMVSCDHTLHFPIEHLSTHVDIFFAKVSIKIFCQFFFIWLPDFLFLTCRSSLFSGFKDLIRYLICRYCLLVCAFSFYFINNVLKS